MHSFIQRIVDQYPQYRKEEKIFESHLQYRENQEMREALVMTQIRLSFVESWFVLLDADERFAFRQLLNSGTNESPAYHAAALRWMQKLINMNQSPWSLREQAIEKITEFVFVNLEMMTHVFSDNESFT